MMPRRRVQRIEVTVFTTDGEEAPDEIWVSGLDRQQATEIAKAVIATKIDDAFQLNSEGHIAINTYTFLIEAHKETNND